MSFLILSVSAMAASTSLLNTCDLWIASVVMDMALAASGVKGPKGFTSEVSKKQNHTDHKDSLNLDNHITIFDLQNQ